MIPSTNLTISLLRRDSKSKRRQSAPPIGGQEEFDPNATRDPEYLRALEKFNEWRRSQPLESSNQATNTSGSLLPLTIPEDSATDLPMISTRRGKQNRLSLPASTAVNPRDVESPQPKNIAKSKHRRERRSLKKTHEDSIMEESPYKKDEDVRLFEELHCQTSAVGAAFELDVEEHISSPPNRFYKKNAKPYTDKLFSKTPTAPDSNIEYATPQRQNNAPTKPSRRKKSGQCGPIPKIRNSLNCSKSKGTETDSTSEPSHFNGSYKNYDMNSSSIYDEYVISSKAYKGNLNKSAHTYQQVVNKHGELVEYALPLVDEDGKGQLAGVDAEVEAAVVERNADDNDRLVDENFKFLLDKCNLNFSDSVRKFIFDESCLPSADRNLQVTDLDKSEVVKGEI